jgi:hypothetical protein
MAIKKVIQVDVKNKIASLPIPATIVCGNGNYQLKFNFDEEWDYEATKTARLYSDMGNKDVVFTGDTCDIPELENVTGVYVGVFSADAQTTTPAYIVCEISIKDLGGSPKPPSPNVYQQILELCEEARDIAQSVRNDADNGEFDGLTPYVGENGNWWIGDKDTGVKAEGTDGKDGLTPFIGENGNWWIGEEDTGVKAEGAYQEALPKTHREYSENVEIEPNIEIVFGELRGAFNVSIIQGESDLSNEWLFVITQGATAYDVVLPTIEWVGDAPTFEANTTTKVALFYKGNTLMGVAV